MKGLGLIVVLAVSGHDAARAVDPPTVRYSLTYVAEPAPGSWEVTVVAEGLDRRARKLGLYLQDWGNWTSAGEPYLTELDATPPLQSSPAERMPLELPRKWDGKLAASYRIPLAAYGSERQQRRLLPMRRDQIASGIALNVLPRITVDGEFLEATRYCEFTGPETCTIVTGWGGISHGTQSVELPGPVDQCPIYFSPEPRVAEAEVDGTHYQVVQFGTVDDCTQLVLDQVQRLIPVCVESTGHDLGKPIRVFVAGGNEGGGGMRSDHGIVLSYDADLRAAHRIHLLAHEMFHEWLPGALPPDGPSLVWFFEGFTDYLSLWLATKSGLLTADQFSARILEIEQLARDSSAFGQTSFANPDQQWRDGDGPLETLAYKGGALLGFHIDAALRKKDDSLVEMLGRWIKKKPHGYSLKRLRDELSRRGLKRFHDQFIVRGEAPPDARDVLEDLGFFEIENEVSSTLAYPGIQTDQGLEPGVITAIDLDGPNAGAGLEVGDRIVDYGPKRTTETRLKDGVVYEFAFGLTAFGLVTNGDWYVIVDRNGEQHRISLEIWGQMDAGLEQAWTGDPDRMAEFFLE